MALLPNTISIPQDLTSTFSTIGKAGLNQIGNNYTQAKQRANQEALTRGLAGPGSYVTDRLGAQQGLDTGNFEATLGGELGGTAYNEALAQRNFDQQKQIADLIGNAAAPSLLQQVFSGIGGGAKAAGQLAPFMGMLKRNSNSVSSEPSVASVDPELGEVYH